jgi:light-harvesting protein B-800-850 alpha chain
MTPEELEEFGQAMVEQIQESVNAYYAQFEDPAQVEEAAAPVEEAAAPVEEAAAPVEETSEVAEVEQPVEEAPAGIQTEAEHSGTIEDAGSPPHKPSAGSAPEGTGLEEGTPEGSGQ